LKVEVRRQQVYVDPLTGVPTNNGPRGKKSDGFGSYSAKDAEEAKEAVAKLTGRTPEINGSVKLSPDGHSLGTSGSIELANGMPIDSSSSFAGQKKPDTLATPTAGGDAGQGEELQASHVSSSAVHHSRKKKKKK
jgi:hypothetical protein